MVLIDRAADMGPADRKTERSFAMKIVGGEGPKNDRKTITREKIMRAAVGQFAVRGYDAVSIQSIVEEADVAHGTIFWHFGNKKALYIEVARWAGNQFYEGMRPELELDGPPSTFAKLATRQFELLQLNPHIGRLFLALVVESIGPHPELRPAMGLFNRRVTDVWRKWALRCAETGRLRPGFDPEVVGMLIVTTLTGANIGSHLHPEDARARFDTIARIFESGCVLPDPNPDIGSDIVIDAPAPFQLTDRHSRMACSPS